MRFFFFFLTDTFLPFGNISAAKVEKRIECRKQMAQKKCYIPQESRKHQQNNAMKAAINPNS